LRPPLSVLSKGVFPGACSSRDLQLTHPSSLMLSCWDFCLFDSRYRLSFRRSRALFPFPHWSLDGPNQNYPPQGFFVLLPESTAKPFLRFFTRLCLVVPSKPVPVVEFLFPTVLIAGKLPFDLCFPLTSGFSGPHACVYGGSPPYKISPQCPGSSPSYPLPPQKLILCLV